MRRIAPLVAVGALAAGLLVATPAAQASPRSYTPPPIDWGTCDNSKLECGFLIVPLDYAKPTGTKIKVAVSRVKHTVSQKRYQGAMLVNPGGPGGSGLGLANLGAYVPDKVGNYYDWIGFDPRGVGSSVPSLSCDPDYAGYDRPQYIPYKPSLEQAWLKKAAGYSADCAKAAGRKLLNHVKTIDTVRDMESIRRALAQEKGAKASKINFYGFSYGTYLGQVYSTVYPARVRRFVWDGVVNPKRVWYPANLDQDYAFERSITKFWKYLAKYDSVFKLGTDWKAIRADYYDQYWKLDEKALDGIGPDEFNDVMLNAGYYVYGWVELGQAFAALVNDGDISGIKAQYPEPGGEGADNGYAMYLATQCTDTTWPTSWAKWRRDNWRVFADAPFVTWGNAWYNAPCRNWPGKPGTPVKVAGTGAKLLMINETLDGATPYSGALTVRRLYKKSVLIEGVNGSTHAGSLSGVDCTDDIIATYLKSGALPKRKAGNRSDVQCPPVPAPDPTAVSAQARSAGGSASPAQQLSRLKVTLTR